VDLGFNASVRLHSNLGIFVTMNPGYAGRSNLPDNLKQLFRAVAMVIPDRRLIARVMLFSQGLETAQELAGKIVLLFQLCEEQLSPQNHYDFGLRALKSVLVGAGRLRRVEPSSSERDLLIRSACDTVVPKLVVEDRPLFASLISGVFPGCSVRSFEDAKLSAALIQVCTENKLECSSGGEWTEKVLQLKQVLDQRHGVMLVGPSGSGKSSAWKTLLSALELADGIKGDAHIIDPKSISKETLYGKLDPTTLEWTDGVFTKLLREVLADRRGGGADRRHWLVFDGDVDPEWAENLNSVLDDNKILTLPSGERLEVPPSVRILLEVDSLRYTTLATISRCGMVWFSEGAVTVSMMLSHALAAVDPPQELLEEWAPQFTAGSLVQVALEAALAEKHVMEASRERLVATLCSLLERGVALLAEYNESRLDSSLPAQHASSFARKWLLYSLLWGFGGSMPHAGRLQLSSVLVAAAAAAGDEDLSSLLDVHVHCSDGRWTPWSASVPRVEIESHRVISSDVVITTTDTVRHTEVLRAWLGSRRPLILCGPPGSGKTMTLTACLQAMPELVMASLNFSSSTSPSLLLKTFAQYCETVRTPQGLVLQPSAAFGQHKWLVVFCDEINLPSADLYGTQCAITFLRQLVEQGGFWRPEDCQWISLRRVQFVGACNPPTDAGRVPLSRRFLRHAPLLLVDFPATESLHQIYSTFNSALLKLHPSLRGQVDALTSAMIDFYELNQGRFTADQHPQYIYSPRELSRWVRALYEAISPLDAVSIEELGRLWAHEGLRLFSDRLVSQDEREWCENSLDTTFRKHFPMCGESCIERPILFSTWLSKYYTSVSKTELREFIGARLKVFYEEELDVPLVVFDEVLEHVIRIDRVLKQPMGHLLLVGESGVGKTVLSKFVSWMNGLSIFQIKATRSYSLDEFDDDLRTIMKRVGCGGERVCFIFDESNVLGAAFLERMNALLASGEVPGLFEGDDYTALMAACREAAARDGVITDSEEELFRRFTTEVQRNLHVVFTMNPASADFSNRSMTSPALYNRCVVDWFGTWSQRALAQVAAEFTAHVDTADTAYSPPSELLSDPLLQGVVDCEHQGLAGAVVSALVQIHSSVKDAAARRAKRSQTRHFLSPRDFLDLIHAFVRIVTEKRSQLEEQQLHINLGLKKLAETQDSVATLQRGLESKEIHLKEKNELANAKLQQMVSDQNEAERGKAEAEALSKELEVQKAEIAQRTEAAQRELSEAEPALQAAQASVRSIKKSQLDELRALARPPKAVQTVLEAVSKMLGNDATEWSDLRKVIAKQDFISSVVNFETDTITEGIIDAVSDIFERAGDLDAESVQRASKACGPLFQWVHSQTNFSRIVQRVAPLRQEVASLQAKSDAVAGQKATMEEQIATLESSIATYKAEYAEAIREIEAIKAEMGTVKQRVSRAEALLRNLIDEKDRWEASSRGFSEQMGTVIGDCLLGGAFMTYCGMFDYRTRLILLSQWKALLQDLCVPMRTDLSLIDYLSRAADRLSWVSKGLPGDDLAMENAIILERFNRFPLVVDPSGQATSFILSRYAERKIVKTSFLDAGFMKTLASAIRFGTPLLVEDVESIDPILNPVLNKELQRTGGRTLIRLGAEDIDFSPQFLIILATRNPASQFTPDLCSRVTMVNFTVTPASLHGQALGTILRAERPDVDARRNSVLQLQGEQSVKLRGLEERLLDTISAAQGDILEDDTIISALEELKVRLEIIIWDRRKLSSPNFLFHTSSQVEAGDVAEEVNRTREVMSEVEATSSLYEPLARACSRVYFAMSSLSEAHFLYQFSLQFFLNILASILGGEKDKDSKDSTESRITTLRGRLFAEAARRVGRSLLNDDKLAFALRLSQIFLEADCGGRAVDGPTPKELELLLHEAAGLSLTGKLSPTGMELGEKQQRELAALCSLPSCAALAQHLQDHPDEWSDFVSSRDSEALGKLPEGWMSADDAASPPRNSLLRLMVVKALRPDRTIAAAEMHLSAVFGEAFPWGEPLDLAEALSTTTSRSPILLACDPGHDAGYKVRTAFSSFSPCSPLLRYPFTPILRSRLSPLPAKFCWQVLPWEARRASFLLTRA
jgi:dynein heavy chain 1